MPLQLIPRHMVNLPESPGGGWELSPGAEIYMRQDGEVTP